MTHTDKINKLIEFYRICDLAQWSSGELIDKIQNSAFLEHFIITKIYI